VYYGGIEPLHIRFACKTTQTQVGIQDFAIKFVEFGVAERLLRCLILGAGGRARGLHADPDLKGCQEMFFFI
jgi:hypothetical protein